MLNSFYAKLSALFLVMILGLGVLLAGLGVQAAQRYADEVEQKVNKTLAAELAPEFEPLLRDSINHRAIRAKIRDMTGINRRIEIYILDAKGQLKASFNQPESEIIQRQIDMAPIRDYLRGAELPILGDDPLRADRRKPFSVAPISVMDSSECFLYVILDSTQYASMASMVAESYIIQAALRGLGIVLLVTGGLGLLLFWWLTKRFRRVQAAVSAFESGDYDRRIDVKSNDELGQLARCFNQMADAVQSSMNELRQADRMRRELIANVSHDLRSPLATIQGYLETVLMKDDLAADSRRRYLQTALRGTRRLNELVSELFELSKLDTEQVEPSMEPFSVVELVQDIVMQHRPQADERSITLTGDLPEHLALARGDVALIERVLTNLIDNALHYTPEGGTVTVAVEQHGPAVRARVRDTGPGIPEDDLPHIFERFYRVDKSRGRSGDKTGGGAGLGLAIADKILDLHDADLQVESEVGEGTVFWFDLPASSGDGAAVQPANVQAAREEATA
jgi:signal transduction histidine kinase